MFHKKKPISQDRPIKTGGAPLKDHTNYYGKELTPEEFKARLLDELDRLEEIKQQALKMGHKEWANSITEQQKETRQLLKEIKEKEQEK